MTINIFVLKGDLNEKIVVVRFFFCGVYEYRTDTCRYYMIFRYCKGSTS